MARPRQVSDEAILAAARAVFLERGASASTEEIARRVGLTQPALFRRFATKDELLLAALAPAAAWPARLEEDAVDERPIELQLRDVAGELLAFFEGALPAFAVLRASGREAAVRGGAEPAPVHSHRVLVRWLDRAVAAGRLAPCDTGTLALVVLGAAQVRPLFGHLAGEARVPGDREAFLDGLVAILLHGVAPRRRP